MISFHCFLILLQTLKADCFLLRNGLKSHDTSSYLNAESELWLDLRGTKLKPSSAQARIEKDLNLKGIVDRFVLDESEKGEDDLDNIIVATSDNKLRGSSLDGIIVRMPESGLLEDPLISINAVSCGEWVLVQFETEEESIQYEGISSLLNLLVGGSILTVDGSFGTAKSDVGGGIAWPCMSKASILQAASAIQSLESVEMTDGGILVASNTEENNDDSPIQSAIILPFDQRLWKTAFNIIREGIY